MRVSIGLPLILGALACVGSTPTGNVAKDSSGTAPPDTLNNSPGGGWGPDIRVGAGSHVVTGANGAPALEVTASIKNASAVHVVLLECPLYVLILADPNGVHPGGASVAMGCPAGSPTRDMAPGDSTTLVRVLESDTLATYAAGQYSVGVVVTTDSAVLGIPAAEVMLPLVASP